MRLWDRKQSSDTELSVLPGSIPLPVGAHPVQTVLLSKGKVKLWFSSPAKSIP